LNKEGDLLIASVSSLFDKEQQRALDLILNSPCPSLNKEGDLLIASASSLFYKATEGVRTYFKLPNFKPPL